MLQLAEPLINRLPLEILSIVFEIVVPKPFQTVVDGGLSIVEPSEKWDWIAITHVCHYWRKTAIRTTSLWTNFTKFRHIGRTKIFLARSGVANLKVFFNFLEGMELQLDEIRQLLLILRHIGLIEELHIRLPDSAGAMSGKYWKQVLVSLKNPAPKLKRLSLLKVQNDDVIVLPRLFSDSTPALQYVYLKGVNIRDHQNMLRSLTDLSLWDIGGITHTLLISLLEVSPALKSLELSFANSWTLSDIGYLKTHHSPSLQRLSITGGSPDIDHQIYWLKSAKFKNSLQWNICRHSGTTPTRDFEIRLGLFDALLQVPMQCKSLSIRTDLSTEVRQIIYIEAEICPLNVQDDIGDSTKVSLTLVWHRREPGDSLWSIIVMLVRSGYWTSAQLVLLDINFSGDVTKDICRELLKEFSSLQSIRLVLREKCKFGLYLADILAEQPSVISSQLKNLTFAYMGEKLEDQVKTSQALKHGLRRRKEINTGVATVADLGVPELGDFDIREFSSCIDGFQYKLFEF